MTEPWGKEGRAALAELRANLPTITKKQRGQVGTRTYAYSDSAAVHTVVDPAMAKAGFLWEADPLIRDDGLFVLRWTLTHLPSEQAKTGDWQIRSETSQGQGSEITYAERYAFKAVTGVKITGDDDDGHAASDANQPQRTRTKIPGPDHERLQPRRQPGERPADRGPIPPDEDLWQDQPPGRFDETPPEERTGSIDGRQRSQIFAKFAILAITDAGAQRKILSGILKRPVDSRKGLSYRDAETVLKDLQARVEAKEAAEEAAAQDAAAEAAGT